MRTFKTVIRVCKHVTIERPLISEKFFWTLFAAQEFISVIFFSVAP